MVQSSGSALTTEWGPIASQSGREWRSGWARRCVNALKEATAFLARERARRDLMALDAHLRRDLGLAPFGPDLRSAGPPSPLDGWIDLRS